MSSLGDTVLLHNPASKQWLRFESPQETQCAWRVEEVLPLLRSVQDAVERKRYWAAGFVSYEAAPAFDPAFRIVAGSGFPAAWFGIYKSPQVAPSPLQERSHLVTEWDDSIDAEAYRQAIGRIKNYIRAGDTYQVNYSLRLKSTAAGDPAALFAAMVAAQGANYAAFIQARTFSICSASPELFFRLDDERLTCRPMKGTAPRGLWPDQDDDNVTRILRSEKNRAENVMIVDMVRNDLGRISQPGSVATETLYQAEKYPTLWQLTSTVSCKTKAGLSEIFQALFPAASITGAPKVRTMEIIAELEKEPRRIYTGAIGFVGPDRQAQFNVAIRTVLIDTRAGTAEYGVGGGIVWDSDPEQELAECRTKAKILFRRRPDFELLESLVWTPAEGFALLSQHMDRLARSAAYFDICVSTEHVLGRLTELTSSLPAREHKVRVRLSREGEVSVEAQELIAKPIPYRIALAAEPINSQDVFLHHKTTNRDVYDQALRRRPGMHDVLLWNERGEVTESTVANLVVEINREWLTPPVACGLLPGTYRAKMLQQGKVREAVIRLEDLARCNSLYLINSVRGMWKVELSGQKVGRT